MASVRAGSRRVSLYNEGLAVYLFDPARRDEVRAAGGAELVDRALDPGGDEDPGVVAAAARAFLVGYELEQDDGLELELAVGPPPGKEELRAVKGARWHRPQTSVLELTGDALAVETANSVRIHLQEEPQEPGAELPVPRGRYLLTLVRLDTRATPEAVQARLEAEGWPQEVATLTPWAEVARKPRRWPLALPWPVPRPSTRWVKKAAVEAGAFTGLAHFADPTEQAWLNLDPAAAAALGLEVGTVLDLESGGRRFTLAFLGEGLAEVSGPGRDVYRAFLGNERTLLPLAREPELMLGGFGVFDAAAPRVLLLMRLAGAPVPAGWVGTWRPAVARPRPGRLPRADLPALGKARLEGGALHGEVLLRLDRYLSLSFDHAALQALGAAPGDRLVLEVGGQARSLELLADAKAAMAELMRLRTFGSESPELEALKDRVVFAAADEKPALAARARALLKREAALYGYLDRHWYEPGQQILLVQPAIPDYPLFGLRETLDFAARPGDPATLRRG